MLIELVFKTLHTYVQLLIKTLDFLCVLLFIFFSSFKALKNDSLSEDISLQVRIELRDIPDIRALCYCVSKKSLLIYIVRYYIKWVKTS